MLGKVQLDKLRTGLKEMQGARLLTVSYVSDCSPLNILSESSRKSKGTIFPFLEESDD
jgi:hypothetical protein